MEAQALKKQINLLDLAKSMGIKQNGPLFHCFNSKEHRNGDKTPSLSIQPGYFKCFGCGIAGDVYAFFQAIEGTDFTSALKRVGQLAGEEISEFSIKKPYIPYPRAKGPAITKAYFDLMEELYGLVKNLPLTKEACAYLTSRGIADHQLAHELGFRDFYPVNREITSMVSKYPISTLGLQREGRLCPSLRVLSGLKIPIFVPSKSFPVAWRTRLYRPWNGIKELGGYGIGMPSYPIGFGRAQEAKTLIIAEGTPDYLSFYQAWIQLWDKCNRYHFDVWGITSVSSGWNPSWTPSLRKYERVIVASHDTSASHALAAQIAKAHEQVNPNGFFLRKLFDENNDANDLLRKGELYSWVLTLLSKEVSHG